MNNKVFADIVPANIFTYVFAMDQLIENGIGNLAGIVVGLLTDTVFHYDKDAVKAGSCAPEEGHKLGMGMFWVCNVAWFTCFLVYLGLHCTYPKDRQRQLALRCAALEARRSEAKSGVVELGAQEIVQETDLRETRREQ